MDLGMITRLEIIKVLPIYKHNSACISEINPEWMTQHHFIILLDRCWVYWHHDQCCDHDLSVFFSAPEGFFLLLNGSGSKDGETASVSLPVDVLSSEICVRFWYYMSGPSVSSLDLLVKTVCTPFLVLLQTLCHWIWRYHNLHLSRNLLKI